MRIQANRLFTAFLASLLLISVAANHCSAQVDPPNLSGKQFNADEKLQWGTTSDIYGKVINKGEEDAGQFIVRFVISDDENIEPSDTQIGSVTVAGVEGNSTVRYESQITLPDNPPAGVESSGRVWVGAIIDATDMIAESDEDDNRNHRTGYDRDRVNVSPPLPDLLGESFSTPSQLSWGQSFNVNAVVANAGAADSAPSKVKFYLSSNDIISVADHYLGEVDLGNVDREGNVSINEQISLPNDPPAPRYEDEDELYIGMIVDAEDDNEEGDERNNRNEELGKDKKLVNVSSGPVQEPDLKGYWTKVQNENAEWGDEVSLEKIQIENAGEGDAEEFQIEWYLSQDKNGDANDILLELSSGDENFTHDTLAAAEIGPEFSVELRLPEEAPENWTGDFYIVMKTDSGDAITESDETNNFGGGPPRSESESEESDGQEPTNGSDWDFVKIETLPDTEIVIQLERYKTWEKDKSASSDNEKQGGTLGRYTVLQDGSEVASGFILEPAGPDSKVAGTDQRLPAGTYRIIKNPGNSGHFRLVMLDEAEAAAQMGRRALCNIHIGNYPTNITGCLAPGRTANENGGAYPSVGSSTIAYNELKGLIEGTESEVVTTYDGRYSYNQKLYDATIIIESAEGSTDDEESTEEEEEEEEESNDDDRADEITQAIRSYYDQFAEIDITVPATQPGQQPSNVEVRTRYMINAGSRISNATTARNGNASVNQLLNTFPWGFRHGKAAPENIKSFVQQAVDQSYFTNTDSDGLESSMQTYGVGVDCSGFVSQTYNHLIDEFDDVNETDFNVNNTGAASLTDGNTNFDQRTSPADLMPGDSMFLDLDTDHVRIVESVDVKDSSVEFVTVESTAADSDIGMRRMTWRYNSLTAFSGLQKKNGTNWEAAGESPVYSSFTPLYPDDDE